MALIKCQKCGGEPETRTYGRIWQVVCTACGDKTPYCESKWDAETKWQNKKKWF